MPDGYKSSPDSQRDTAPDSHRNGPASTLGHTIGDTQRVLQIAEDTPNLTDATLLLALTGWMDGGLVSTGTVRRLMEGREMKEIGHIQADPFYIYNFPGSMEVAALFRPEVQLEEGVIQSLDLPTNQFHVDVAAKLVFFVGKEPNLLWQAFADCIFEVAHRVGVSRIIFIGSFGGTVPHTREPRLFGSVSHEKLRTVLQEHGVKLSGYKGPSSFATLLLSQSPKHEIEMISLSAEIPGYLEGLNPLSIEAVTRRLARLINQPVDLDALRRASTEWEMQVTQAVDNDEKLANTIRRLEEQYDNDLIGRPVEDVEVDEEEDEEQEEEE
jgi:proteasome assembly chaperone (PAC2) family protein